MKRCRYWLLILVVAVVIAGMSGCRKEPYSLEQSIENVESVEICRYKHKTDSVKPIVSLSKSEYTELLSELPKLEYCLPLPFDQPPGYGEIVVYIIYKNQEVEIVGDLAAAYFHTNSGIDTKLTDFKSDGWYALLSKYAENVADLRMVEDDPNVSWRPLPQTRD